MIEIKLQKPSGDEMAGTTLTLNTMRILREAGIMNPGRFEVDNMGEAVIVIKTISTQVAEVLRNKLPERGYVLLPE